MARSLIEGLRERPTTGLVQGLMREYALSSQEGVALMCLAEALLRVPDAATRDALIADKIGGGDWRAHVGHSPSPFVNASTWGLLITGQLIGAVDETGLAATLTRSSRAPARRSSAPASTPPCACSASSSSAARPSRRRLATRRALEARGYRYSYDMLGEAAATAADADALPLPHTRRRSKRSARLRPGVASTKGRVSPSSFRRCIRAIGAASAGG